MKGIRSLESDIIEYQGVLRARTYEKEMEIYRQIGLEKIETFENHWESVFRNFEKNCEEKMKLLLEDHESEIQELEDNLDKNIDIFK